MHSLGGSYLFFFLNLFIRLFFSLHILFKINFLIGTNPYNPSLSMPWRGKTIRFPNKRIYFISRWNSENCFGKQLKVVFRARDSNSNITSDSRPAFTAAVGILDNISYCGDLLQFLETVNLHQDWRYVWPTCLATLVRRLSRCELSGAWSFSSFSPSFSSSFSSSLLSSRSPSLFPSPSGFGSWLALNTGADLFLLCSFWRGGGRVEKSAFLFPSRNWG